mmetsp:Transcript_8154/g.13559  ORF Transcript_8154/g.13559 Transcript_8154/m.13559 type:complete len:145 (+) Transcript_8154:859-1293(+)
MDMKDTTRNVGGPDSPPLTKLQQLGTSGSMIYEAFEIPPEKRLPKVSLPVAVLDTLIGTFALGEAITKAARFCSEWQRECARIVRYYATEPMVALGEGEIQGRRMLKDHFRSIARRGNLEEIDKMTTTLGVLETLVAKDPATSS